MRRIPRLGRGVVAQALAVAVADHGCALGAARPVAAGSVLAGRKGPSVHLRARKNVVSIGRVANAGNHGPALGQRHLHAEFVVVAMKIVDVLGDDLVFEILPGAASDAVAGIDGLRAVGDTSRLDDAAAVTQPSRRNNRCDCPHNWRITCAVSLPPRPALRFRWSRPVTRRRSIRSTEPIFWSAPASTSKSNLQALPIRRRSP